MDHWTEIRTAFVVAQLGTISAAADALGVHRATVNRHVDLLEQAFGTKLFQRHARGYEPTDAGRDLLDVAGRADEMFSDLQGRLRGQAEQLTGVLNITSLSGVAPLLMPSIRRFKARHPDITVKFMAEERLARLEYGEAHIAIRAGKKPQDPDYVVRRFQKVDFAIYASQTYIDANGRPDLNTLDDHQFAGSRYGPAPLPYTQWTAQHVPQSAITLETEDPSAAMSAIDLGLAIGFMSDTEAAKRTALVKVIAPQDDLSIDLWLVTHVDLHRTAKVQAYLNALRDKK